MATAVDLGGASLTAGDGLLVVGRTLYVVQNQLNTVAVIQLEPSGTSGVLVDRLTSPEFQVPTTVATPTPTACSCRTLGSARRRHPRRPIR